MQEYLLADLRAAYGVAPSEITPVAGGYLNLKWKLRTERGELLLKQYSPERFDREDLARIEGRLQRQMLLERCGVRCPRLWTCGGHVIRHLNNDTAYMLMDFCPGQTQSPDTVTPAQMHSLGEECAALHAAFLRVPQSRVSQSRVPPTRVPQSRVSPTRVPQSRVSQSRVPQSRVPQSRVSPTRVSPTQVSQSRVPQSRVPPLRVPSARVPPASDAHALPRYGGYTLGALRDHFRARAADRPPDAPDAYGAYLEALGALEPILARLPTDFPDLLHPASASPMGWAHEDFHAGNLLFDARGVTAILDFDRSCYSYVWHDVGRALLSLALTGERLDAMRLDVQRVRAFVEGYARHARLSPADIARALRLTWCVETVWWIRPEFFGPCDAIPARFLREMLWLTRHWRELEDIASEIITTITIL